MEFTNNFHRINAAITSNHLLGRIWEEYVETLIPPLEEVDDPSYRVYRNTVRPQLFFTEDAVLQHIRPWMDGERLVGIGLTLTFLGLVAALSLAGTVFANGTAGEIQIALATLLSTAGAKFLASIGGLSGSIIQSMFQNFYIHRASKNLDKLNDLIERRLSYASVERIAADQYGHAQRQTRRLEEMSTEITLALGQRIEDTISRMPGMMGEEFSKALTPMITNLETVTDKLSNGSSEALGNMVTEFANEVKGAGQASMEAVVSQLDALSDTLNGTVGSLADSNNKIRVSMEDVLITLDRTSRQFEKAFEDGAIKAADKLESSSSSMGKIMEDLLLSSKAQQDASQQTLSDLKEQFESASTQMTNVMKKNSEQASQEMGEAVAHNIGTILEQARTSTATISTEVGNALGAVGSDMRDNLNSLTQEIGERLQTAIASIELALNGWKDQTGLVNTNLSQINTELNANNQGLISSGETIKEASLAFKDVASDVRSVSQPLSQAAQQTAQAVKSLESVSSESLRHMTSITESVDSAVQTTKESIAALNTTWQAQSNQLNTADKALEEAFKHITTNLGSSLATLEKFSGDLDKNVSKSLDIFASIVTDLSDSVDELKKVS